MGQTSLRYLSDEDGKITAVVIPIEAWREIASEVETQHLLKSPVMRERLLNALGREGGVSYEEALGHLQIAEPDSSKEN